MPASSSPRRIVESRALAGASILCHPNPGLHPPRTTGKASRLVPVAAGSFGAGLGIFRVPPSAAAPWSSSGFPLKRILPVSRSNGGVGTAVVEAEDAPVLSRPLLPPSVCQRHRSGQRPCCQRHPCGLPRGASRLASAVGLPPLPPWRRGRRPAPSSPRRQVACPVLTHTPPSTVPVPRRTALFRPRMSSSKTLF